MKRNANIYRFILMALGLALFLACNRPAPAGEETPPPPDQTQIDGRGFDPLGLPQDRQIVPKAHPQVGAIEGRGALVDVVPEVRDSVQGPTVQIPASVDTLNGQAYRVQLFTSKVYGEARQEVAVAEEIFDRSVYLDYEVPYYKVRVGSFGSREKAEEYQQMAKTAGYRNAWVVMVNLGVKEAKPLYDEVPDVYIEEPPTPGTGQDQNE